MSIARRALAGPLLFALLVLVTGSTSVSAASPSTVVGAPATVLTRVGFSTYLSHAISSNDKWLALLDDEGFALDMSDDQLIGKADLAMRNFARKEYRWFTTHKPSSACFTAIWNSEKAGAHYADLAFTDLSRYWLNWPNVSQSVFDRGLRYYDKWSAQTDRTTSLVNRNKC